MKIWTVNTRTKKLTIKPTPKSWQHLGGRGLIARIMVDEVEPTCEPLGPKNKLIFAPGLLVGHMLSSCDRISIGGKSPLTGGVKEANAGGSTGLALTHLGIKALILEDHPDAPGLWVIHLSNGGARFDEAGEFAGVGVYEVAPKLQEKYGKAVAIALIGPGGEMKMTGAGVQNIDMDSAPSRIAARGGLGAVMGSKGIKAIVIDTSNGEKPPIADLPSFRAAQKRYNKALIEHPMTQALRDYGTSAQTNICNNLGALPTRNFTQGEFKGAEKISGEFMRELLLERGDPSSTTHACMRGCTIQCSNVFGSDQGEVITSPIEYEMLGMLGSNLGIDDLDTVAELTKELNDLGLDIIEIGAALGVAAEAGLMDFGDGARALELVAEIRSGSRLGRILGNGVCATGKELGVERVPSVKGQAMSAYDPRAIKGTGVTFATSPQGADHTSGLTIRFQINHTDPKGQAKLSLEAQIGNAGLDTLGICLFAGFGFRAAPGTIRDLLNARYGWDVEDDISEKVGRECLKLEREFNRLGGFTSADDRLPEWLTREELAPTNAVFDVPEEDLDTIFNW